MLFLYLFLTFLERKEERTMSKTRLFAFRPKLKRTLVSDEELSKMLIPTTLKVFKTKEELQEEYKTTPEHTVFSVHPDGYAAYKVKDGHHSMFYYGQEMTDHFATGKTESGLTGSESGYNGPVYGDWLFFDFDKKDDQEGCAKLMLSFLTYLQEEQIVHLLFSSGSKGFHLYIPKGYLDYPSELESKWNIVCAMFAEQIARTFPELSNVMDKGIYTKVKLLRGANCSHDNGSYKRQLIFKQETQGSYKEWFEPIKFDRETCKGITSIILEGIPVDKHKWKLEVNLTLPKETTISEESEFKVPYLEKRCIYKMLTDKSSPERHKTMLRIIAWVYEKGLPESAAEQILLHWNSQLNHPISEREIQHDMKSWGKYVFTCTDEVKLRYCDNKCSYWVEHQAKTKAFTAKSCINSYKESLLESSEYHIDLSKRWGFKEKWIIKPERGHITTVIAASGVGKTIFLMNLMLAYPKINFLFFSYEMSKEEIVERFISMLDLNTDLPGWEHVYYEKTKHIIVVDDSAIPLDEHMAYKKALEANLGIEIRMIVCDYLQITPVKEYDGNKLLISSTESANTIASKVKGLAKENRVGYLWAAQPTAFLQGNGNTPLSEDAGKDGQSIQSMSDFIITEWRPNKDTAGEVDDIMTIFGAKNRHGGRGAFINCEWWGHKLTIGDEITTRNIKQRDFLNRK